MSVLKKCTAQYRNNPIKPYEGANSLSPFVTLKDR